MKRFTISLDEDIAYAFDNIMKEQGYENRSEAFRDLLRHYLGQDKQKYEPNEPCVATLSYVYDHHQRKLSSRLTDLQHDHHELTISTLHAHLDHNNCVEVVILCGKTNQVRNFANSIITQSGVSFGSLNIVPLVTLTHHKHLG
jgi:CopG family transcriptional regulator, nickel-responsive regulator